jgi:hypothetical protein
MANAFQPYAFQDSAFQTTIELTADLNVTLDDCSLLSEASTTIAANLSAVLDDCSLLSAATTTIAADLSAVLDDATLSASATLAIEAALDTILEATSLLSAAASVLVANLNVTLADTTLVATGQSPPIPPVTPPSRRPRGSYFEPLLIPPLRASLNVLLEDCLLEATAILQVRDEEVIEDLVYAGVLE